VAKAQGPQQVSHHRHLLLIILAESSPNPRLSQCLSCCGQHTLEAKSAGCAPKDLGTFCQK